MGKSLFERARRIKNVASVFVSRQTITGLVGLLGASVVYTLGFVIYAYWKYPDPGPLPRSYIFLIAPLIYLVVVLPIVLPSGIAMVLLLNWVQRYKRRWRSWQWVIIGAVLGLLGGVLAIPTFVKFFPSTTKYGMESFEIIWALIVSTLTGAWYSIKLQE